MTTDTTAPALTAPEQRLAIGVDVHSTPVYVDLLPATTRPAQIIAIEYTTNEPPGPDPLRRRMLHSAGLGASMAITATGILLAFDWRLDTRPGHMMLMLIVLGATMAGCGTLYASLDTHPARPEES